MRTLMLFLLMASTALADLPRKLPDEEPERPALAVIVAPCLEPRRERQYVVTWWIENKVTGERRALDSQAVRVRC